MALFAACWTWRLPAWPKPLPADSARPARRRVATTLNTRITIPTHFGCFGVEAVGLKSGKPGSLYCRGAWAVLDLRRRDLNLTQVVEGNGAKPAFVVRPKDQDSIRRRRSLKGWSYEPDILESTFLINTHLHPPLPVHGSAFPRGEGVRAIQTYIFCIAAMHDWIVR
jgi:hypothetical protein